MAVNKVEFGDQVIMDITDSTADTNNMLNGTIAYKANGERVVGGLTVVDVEANPAANATDSLNKLKIDDTVYNFNDLLKVNETLNVDPYIKRAIPSGAYTEKMKSIIGASAVWNQLIKNGNFADTSEWSCNATLTFTATNNVGTLSITNENAQNRLWQSINAKANHKYLVRFTAKSSKNNTIFTYFLTSNSSSTMTRDKSIGTTWKEYASILTYAEDREFIELYFGQYQTADIDLQNFNIFDLTAMFGSAIADYVYTLETQTAGSGIAWLKSYGFFTENYYSYSANKIESVSVSAKKNVGKNLLKPIYEFGNFIGGNDHKQLHCTNLIFLKSGESFSVSLEDYTKYSYIVATSQYNEIPMSNWSYGGTPATYQTSNGTFTVNKDCWLGLLVKQDTNFSSINDLNNVKIQIERGSVTSYEPYTETTYPLDHTTLRGLFQLDANNNLYADGDIYPSSGSGSVKYAEVDLGSLNWTTIDGANHKAYLGFPLAKKPNTNNDVINAICLKYPVISRASEGYNPEWTVEGIGIDVGGSLFIGYPNNSWSTLSEIQTALSGVKLIYELATPTSASLTPYTSLQNIENGGTEEFIDYGVEQSSRDVAIPAGTETYFGDNKLVKDVEDITPFKPLDYSTSEQITGQKWIDGSDIYRRTFTGTIDSNTHGTTEIADFTDLQPIACNGWFMDTSGVGMALGYFPNSTSWASALHIDSNHKLILFTESALAAGTYYVTVDYIKTS